MVLCVVAEDIERVWVSGLEVCDDVAFVCFSERFGVEVAVDDVKIIISACGCQQKGWCNNEWHEAFG